MIEAQSAAVQQFAIGMQLAPHAFCMGGQLQEPPGPEHIPAEQSAVVQQFALGMHCEKPGTMHALNPDRHAQVPPGDGQISPPTAMQSVLLQQLPLAMQLADVWQTCWFVGQTQVPTALHVWPAYAHTTAG